MFILFTICLWGGLIMFFIGTIRQVAYYSKTNWKYSTAAQRRIQKAKLKRHWLITVIIIVVMIYSGLHL